MSSLDYTYNHLDETIDRTFMLSPETLPPERTALLALDIQKLIVDPKGAAHVESVGGAPAGRDVVQPCMNVIDACRNAGVQVLWSLWGLYGDGRDAGTCSLKWPPLKPGEPDSPASWGNRDAELADGLEPRDDEPVMYKHRFCSLYNTPMDEYLRQWDIEYLAIAGVTSANCLHATAIDAWNRNYKVIALADTTTAIPHSALSGGASGPGEPPPGYGQHWEALRNVQMNYGDVLLSTEFLKKIGQA